MAVTARTYTLPQAAEVNLGKRTITFPKGTTFQVQIPDPGSITEGVRAKVVKRGRPVGAYFDLPESVVGLLMQG